jgi:hypothetical protein
MSYMVTLIFASITSESMKLKAKSAVIVMLAVSTLAACATNKKRRCNTCPKWEDRIEWTSQQSVNEEQHQSGVRP